MAGSARRVEVPQRAEYARLRSPCDRRAGAKSGFVAAAVLAIAKRLAEPKLAPPVPMPSLPAACGQPGHGRSRWAVPPNNHALRFGSRTLSHHPARPAGHAPVRSIDRTSTTAIIRALLDNPGHSEVSAVPGIAIEVQTHA